eukprot:INCI13437.4.p1 GENE.INCI13437.4~~INCI13437.4.p1  ORF type:complete len:276 (+),score=86.32 INCI13437.4:800-1627(+)
MAASFQQRRLSVLSPAKGKISTSSTSSHSSASEFDALFGATSSKQGGGAVKSTASKHTVVISDDDDDSDDDDFETMSLAQRMASVRVSPKQTAAVKDTSLTKVVAKKAIAKKVAAKKVTTSTSAKAKSYTKMKMAELRELLRERGLKETGRKKADLVARLEEADSQGGGAAEEKDFNSPVVSQRAKKCRVSLSPSTVNDEVEEIDSESSDEESASSSCSSTSGSAPSSRARPSRRAAAKKATYVFDDSEEDNEDDFEEEEQDSSFEEGDSEGGWD